MAKNTHTRVEQKHWDQCCLSGSLPEKKGYICHCHTHTHRLKTISPPFLQSPTPPLPKKNPKQQQNKTQTLARTGTFMEGSWHSS